MVAMRVVCIVVVLGLACAKHPVRQEIVDRVNNDPKILWAAEEVGKNLFANHTIEQIRGLMGLQGYGRAAPPKRGMQISVQDTIPASYDARETYSSCQFSIRNQASCGSCWAFGAAETLGTNLCVLGVSHEILSPQDLISCDTSDHACHGGTLPNVWEYMQQHGVASDSSDPYASGDGSCDNTCVPACPAGAGSSTNRCPVQYTTLESDTEIQAAVMTGGAVEVGFFVMEDFMNYKSGIFHSTSQQTLGGHAVKIVGWGHQGETFFWVVQNSWGSDWGESGFFRIENWHEDNESSIAIGGGWACIEGDQPTPPSPAPPPATCDDIVGYCGNEITTAFIDCPRQSYLIPLCKKTCGCCDDLAPSYCPSDKQVEGGLLV